MSGANLKRLAVAPILIVSAVASFAADWPSMRGNPQNTGASAEVLKPPFKAVWTLKGATNEALLISGGKLFYTSRRYGGLRDLVQVDVRTKAAKTLVKNVAQTGAVAPALGRIFTVLRTTDKPSSVSKLGANMWQCAIAAVDLKSGKVLWKHPIGEHPVTPAVSPIATDGKYVYLVNIPYWVPGDPVGPASLVCLDAKSGEQAGFYEWPKLFGNQVGVTAGPPAVDAASGRVAIALAYQGPDAYAGQLWIFRAGAGVNDGPVERVGGPDGALGHQGAIGWPVVAGGGLLGFAPGDKLSLWNVSGQGAAVKWSSRASAGKALAVTGGAKPIVLVGDSGARKLTAVALETGKPAWSRQANVTGLSACATGVVFVPCQEKHPVKAGAKGRTDILDGVILALNPSNGKPLWSTRKPDVTYNQPVIGAGRLFVSDTDGAITCYAPAGK